MVIHCSLHSPALHFTKVTWAHSVHSAKAELQIRKCVRRKKKQPKMSVSFSDNQPQVTLSSVANPAWH